MQMSSAIIAALHYFALAMSFWSIAERARNLWLLQKNQNDTTTRDKVLFYDNFWGLSALLIISTGILRAFYGYEKGAEYYLNNFVFYTKFGMVVAILLLELYPMFHFVKWRIRIAKSSGITFSALQLKWFFVISSLQIVILSIIILLASLMARGIGMV